MFKSQGAFLPGFLLAAMAQYLPLDTVWRDCLVEMNSNEVEAATQRLWQQRCCSPGTVATPSSFWSVPKDDDPSWQLHHRDATSRM